MRSSTPGRRLVAALAVAAAMVAACGDADQSIDTTLPAPSSVTPAATAPATDRPTVPATAPPTTTVTTTVATTTPTTPPTTPPTTSPPTTIATTLPPTTLPPTTLPPTTLPPTRSGHIADLIAEGAILATPRGAGITDLDLDLENLLDELLDVEIPPGTYFVAGSGGVQNMVVRTATTIELEPNELLRTLVDVACSNLRRDIPEDDDRFTVQREQSDSMSRLMQVLDDAGAAYSVAQAATWIVSDDADYDDLGVLITSPGRTRLIDEADAGTAMQLVDEAGIDITGRRIWRDRDTIADGADPSYRAWLEQR